MASIYAASKFAIYSLEGKLLQNRYTYLSIY